MRHWRLSLEYIEAAPAPNLVANCRQKGALVSQRPKKHAGQKSRGSRRSFQLRSPSELCPRRLVARLRRLSGRGGQRSSRRKRRLDVDETGCFQNPKPRLPEHLTVHLESECFKQFRWHIPLVFVSTHPLPQFRRT